MSNVEEDVWTGRPSQWIEFPHYVIYWLLVIILTGASGFIAIKWTPYAWWGLVILPILFILLFWTWLCVRSVDYRLTSQRLIIETGILSRKTEEIELYRVTDWQIVKPFWLRLIGRGHVVIETNDRSSEQVVLQGVTGPDNVRELLREHVEVCRDRKRVRHLEVGDADGEGGGFSDGDAV